jgi:hypothetical protein
VQAVDDGGDVGAALAERTEQAELVAPRRARDVLRDCALEPAGDLDETWSPHRGQRVVHVLEAVEVHQQHGEGAAGAPGGGGSGHPLGEQRPVGQAR